jgi:hypothetical protein
MCGGFSPPPPDPAAEAERKARMEALEAQKAQAQAERSKDKQARLGDALMRSGGLYGARSLISGRKGGSGFGREMIG